MPGEAARDLLRHAAGRLAPQHFHIHIKALGQATGCRERTRIDGRELRERRQALPNLITIGRRRLFAWLADGTCRNGFTWGGKCALRHRRRFLCTSASYWEIDGADCDVNWE